MRWVSHGLGGLPHRLKAHTRRPRPGNN